MPDIADRAAIAIENHEADGIAHARHALTRRSLEPCGVCHWCGEPLRQAGQLFCDNLCADDHATHQKRGVL